jgi:hypothetical protein
VCGGRGASTCWRNDGAQKVIMTSHHGTTMVLQVSWHGVTLCSARLINHTMFLTSNCGWWLLSCKESAVTEPPRLLHD